MPQVANYMVFLYVTCKNSEEAQKIGHALIEKRIAGWVNSSAINSIYRENGEIKESAGISLIVKTVESKVQDVEDVVRALQSHKVPCIASFSLYRLNREYKDWLIGCVT